MPLIVKKISSSLQRQQTVQGVEKSNDVRRQSDNVCIHNFISACSYVNSCKEIYSTKDFIEKLTQTFKLKNTL